MPTNSGQTAFSWQEPNGWWQNGGIEAGFGGHSVGLIFCADPRENKMINPAPGFWSLFGPPGPLGGSGNPGNGFLWFLDFISCTPAIDVTKLRKFTWLGAMDVAKPFKFITLGPIDDTNRINVEGLGP